MRRENEEMSSEQLNQYLENIARLIEATASTPADAAKIVRESKIAGKPNSEPGNLKNKKASSDR